MSKDIKKLCIVYAVTGVVVLLSIPVLGAQQVVEILGDTSIEVVIAVALLGVALGIYAFVKGQLTQSDRPEDLDGTMRRDESFEKKSTSTDEQY